MELLDDPLDVLTSYGVVKSTTSHEQSDFSLSLTFFYMISCKYRWNSYKFSIGRHCVALVTLFQWIFVTSTRCSKYYLFQTLLNNGKTQICHTIETSQQNCIVQVRMYNSRTILFCNECYVEFGSVHCLTQCVGWMLMS